MAGHDTARVDDVARSRLLLDDGLLLLVDDGLLLLVGESNLGIYPQSV